MMRFFKQGKVDTLQNNEVNEKISVQLSDKNKNMELGNLLKNEIVPFFIQNMPHDLLRISPADVAHFFYKSSAEKIQEDPTARSYDDLDDEQFNKSLAELRNKKIAQHEGSSLLENVCLRTMPEGIEFYIQLAEQGSTLRDHSECKEVWNKLEEALKKNPDVKIDITSDDREVVRFTANSISQIENFLKDVAISLRQEKDVGHTPLV